MFNDKRKHFQKGQTLLFLLVFMAIALTITSASLYVLLNSLDSGTKRSDSILAYDLAESGAENALLRLVRNPIYTGETLTVGDGSATLLVTPGNPITITSLGKVRNSVRKIQMEIVYNIGILNVVSWKEIF